MRTYGIWRWRLVLPVVTIGLMILFGFRSDTALAQEPLGAGPPFLIGSAALDDFSPAVAYNPSQHLFIVVWETGGSIHGQIVAEDGTLLGPVFVVNGAFGAVNGTSPAIAYDGSTETFLVAWSQYQGGGSVPRMDIYAQRIAGDGWGTAGEFWVSSTGSAGAPAIAANSHDGQFLVVWESNSSVYGQRVAGAGGGSDLIGGVLGVAQRFVGPGYEVGYLEPAVAYNRTQNRFLTVYTRVTVGTTTTVDDISGRMVSATGILSPQSVIDYNGFPQGAPAVAACPLNPARPFLVVFEDGWNDWPDTDIRARLVDADGFPASEPLCITCSGAALESKPDVIGSDGFGYTVVWQQYESNWSIEGRRVGPDASLGSTFDVAASGSTPASSAVYQPAVAGGSPVALVAWQDDGWGSGTFDITGRLLGFRTQLPAIRR